MSEQKPLIYGIIHIGSSNLSLRIVEYKNVNEVRVIESVRKDTNFGEEVFNHKNLSFASIRKLCRMLNGLKQLLSDYQVKVYAAYATAVFLPLDPGSDPCQDGIQCAGRGHAAGDLFQAFRPFVPAEAV